MEALINDMKKEVDRWMTDWIESAPRQVKELELVLWPGADEDIISQVASSQILLYNMRRNPDKGMKGLLMLVLACRFDSLILLTSQLAPAFKGYHLISRALLDSLTEIEGVGPVHARNLTRLVMNTFFTGQSLWEATDSMGSVSKASGIAVLNNLLDKQSATPTRKHIQSFRLWWIENGGSELESLAARTHSITESEEARETCRLFAIEQEALLYLSDE